MANVETLGALERRVSMSLPAQEIEREGDERLRKLARNMKMPGFRPGKGPLKLVEKTIGILRKQRTRFVAVSRPAKDGDRLTVEFNGTIDGQPFAGGAAENFAFTIGEGRMLPEFDTAARGMSAGEKKSFELTFPGDYHGKEVAGKRATFELSVKGVEEAQLPDVDAEFAKSLGIGDGSLEKMRSEIRANVERETN